MEATFDKALLVALARWGLAIAPAQLGQLRAHYQAVVEANRMMNLTRIVEPIDAAVKHYADSLAFCLWARERDVEVQTLLDVGTGAGFPAVPLAVIQPNWALTAIDATGKKADFVTRAAAAIGLANLRVEHAHAQHWRPRTTFQFAVLRAVTGVLKAVHQAARHVAPGGGIVVYQTAAGAEAVRADACTESSVRTFHLDEVYPYTLDLGDKTLARALLVFRMDSLDRANG